MKTETILNAMEKVSLFIQKVEILNTRLGFPPMNPNHPRCRQYRAFRARILQKYHALELLVQLQNEGLVQRKARIAELEQERDAYRAKAIEGAEWMTYALDADQRIAELERELRGILRPFDDPTGKYELTNEEWSND